jgi:3-deoxy-D-manno-octulosonic-acid transferase
MARLLYSLLLYLLCPLILLHLWCRGKKAPAYRERWNERFGKIKPGQVQPNSLVFHCASVGEVIAATPLIKQVQQQYPEHSILVTCNTPTGTEQIKRSFGTSVQHVYLPMDLPHAVNRFLSRVKPVLLCIVETELWPNLISQSRAKGIDVVVVNARLSEKSLRGYQKVAPLSKVIVKGISKLVAHNEDDAQRFMTLGLEKNKVVVSGSIKFDISINEQTQLKAQQFKQYPQANQPIWIAGSTHGDEDALLIGVHKTLLKTSPEALLILVPRHPERFDEVADEVAMQVLTLQRKSQLADDKPREACQVLLGDTMGELLTLYGCADVAFIGGSLIERGGHNPLEAAAYGIPVITGPHVFNFLHVYPALLEDEGCLQVSSVDELAPLLSELFNDKVFSKAVGSKGKMFVEKNQGAIAKTILVIDGFV